MCVRTLAFVTSIENITYSAIFTGCRARQGKLFIIYLISFFFHVPLTKFFCFLALIAKYEMYVECYISSAEAFRLGKSLQTCKAGLTHSLTVTVCIAGDHEV